MAAFWLSWQSKGKGWPWPHGQITSLWTRGRSKNKKVDLCQFLWKTLGNLLEVELLNAHSHALQAHHLFFANFPTESPRSIHDARWTHHHSTSYNVYEKKSSKDQQSAPVQGSQKLEYYCWWKKSCTSWGPVVYPTIDRVLYIPSGLLAGFLFTINSSICSCYVTRCVSRILKSWNQRIRWEWNSATEFHGRLHVRTSPCLTACGGNWGKQISPGTHQPIVFRRNESRPIKNTWRSMMKYLSVWETTEPSISDQNITPTITALVFPCPQKV